MFLFLFITLYYFLLYYSPLRSYNKLPYLVYIYLNFYIQKFLSDK